MTAQSRVAITTVTGGPPNWHYVNSVFGLRTPGEKIFHYLMGKQGIDEGHNELIRWFLSETDYEWMLHLDSDAIVHPNTLLRLLSWDKPFVSALAFQRRPPFMPVVYKGEGNIAGHWKRQVEMTLKWLSKHPKLVEMCRPTVLEPRPDDALYEVDRGGAHCLLVHRKVFETIPDPWFTRYDTGAGSGSDFTFYRLAQEAGFTTWLDRSVLAGHLTNEHVVGAMDFAIWSRACIWTDGGQPAGLAVTLPEINLEE